MLSQNKKINYYEFSCDDSIAKKNRTIIIELSIPSGGRIIYGVLGVFFKYKSEKKLFAKIPTTYTDEKVFNNSILSRFEKIYVGLPAEYSNGIYDAVKQIFDKDKLLLTGELDFCYAAHGTISSNRWVFQKLTYVLVNLLSVTENDINKELLIELLNRT